MNRRDFLAATSTVIGAGMVAGHAPDVAAASTAGPIAPAASKLYRQAVVLDANLGPDFEDTLPQPAATLTMLRESGVTAMKTTMGGFNADFEATLAEIGFYQRVIEFHHDLFIQVRRPSDFAAAKRDKRIGILFSFEGVEMLGGKVERIQLFRDLGVRVMQLSYNPMSPFAAGVLAPTSSGLTDLGVSAVQKMNELGVTIDVSHANAKTTADVLARSKKPVVITHAGCAAVHAHPRNKTDEQLRAIAGQGGVVGIYDLPYLTPSPRQPALDDYIEHMRHALKICGEDHVGIGSDTGIGPFDTSPAAMAEFNKSVEQRRASGVSAPGEDRPTYVQGLNGPTRCEVIADALLKAGYSARVAEKVLGANFVRAFTDAWGTPG